MERWFQSFFYGGGYRSGGGSSLFKNYSFAAHHITQFE